MDKEINYIISEIISKEFPSLFRKVFNILKLLLMDVLRTKVVDILKHILNDFYLPLI